MGLDKPGKSLSSQFESDLGVSVHSRRSRLYELLPDIICVIVPSVQHRALRERHLPMDGAVPAPLRGTRGGCCKIPAQRLPGRPGPARPHVAPHHVPALQARCEYHDARKCRGLERRHTRLNVNGGAVIGLFVLCQGRCPDPATCIVIFMTHKGTANDRSAGYYKTLTHANIHREEKWVLVYMSRLRGQSCICTHIRTSRPRLSADLPSVSPPVSAEDHRGPGPADSRRPGVHLLL